MRSVNDIARDEDLLKRIKELGGGGYQDVAYLRDGTIIGIGDLMFTRAIYIDLDLNGWSSLLPLSVLMSESKAKSGLTL